MKSLIPKALYLLSIAALAGCASSPTSIQSIPLESGLLARYALPAAFTGNLGDKNAVAEYLDRARQSALIREGMYGYQGKEVKAEGGRVTVSYINESGFGLGRVHNLRATLEVSFEDRGAEKILSVRCPDALSVEFNNGSGMGTYPSYVTREQAIADLKRMCLGLRFEYSKSESGELNVPFGDSAVFANFTRKLPAHSSTSIEAAKQFDIAKYRWFVLSDGDKKIPIGITVFPYRNGSKVSYVWSNRFTCIANKQCGLDGDAPRRINAIITSIAND